MGFSDRYADRNEADHAASVEAVGSGRIEAVGGLQGSAERWGRREPSHRAYDIDSALRYRAAAARAGGVAFSVREPPHGTIPRTG